MFKELRNKIIPTPSSLAHLGDEVIDTVSGFSGVIISTHHYLHGCTRCTVQPKVGDDGKLPDTASFDLPQLNIIARNVAKEGDRSVGGPAKYMPSDKPTC